MPRPPTAVPHDARPFGVRGLAVLLLVLQVLAPWLHAHTSVSRTVGFHLHVAGGVPAANAPAASAQSRWHALVPVAVAAFSASDESPSVGMPGGWLRGGDPAAAEQPVLVSSHGPAVAVAPAVLLRVSQLQAPRPPPALALVAYASQAPPAASSPLTRG